MAAEPNTIPIDPGASPNKAHTKPLVNWPITCPNIRVVLFLALYKLKLLLF
ncbi:hypothetical protein [Spiroplasma endosymbiont of Seladonia tumulorum]|uniref:hypothetical protein n=1 Tax=Spiroplasma endosymbiont of Seladonia tumulorum TaxID=3066321 RepID=UPI0030D2B180